MKLYHGSKSGIKGDIQCNLSRDKCDFGPGFYMGDKPEQPMGDRKSTRLNSSHP